MTETKRLQEEVWNLLEKNKKLEKENFELKLKALECEPPIEQEEEKEEQVDEVVDVREHGEGGKEEVEVKEGKEEGEKTRVEKSKSVKRKTKRVNSMVNYHEDVDQDEDVPDLYPGWEEVGDVDVPDLNRDEAFEDESPEAFEDEAPEASEDPPAKKPRRSSGSSRVKGPSGPAGTVLVCPESGCDEQFRSESSLLRHKRVVHRGQGFRCKEQGSGESK